MVEENFSKACNEVLQVLKNIETSEYNKIPKEFIDNLEENADYEYKSHIDFNKEFEEQDLLPETIDILAYIYRKFWCNEQEKSIFDKAMYQNERKYQEKLKTQNNQEDFFIKRNNKKQYDKKVENNLPANNNKNIFRRIIIFLKTKIQK